MVLTGRRDEKPTHSQGRGVREKTSMSEKTFRITVQGESGSGQREGGKKRRESRLKEGQNLPTGFAWGTEPIPGKEKT